MLRFGCSTNFWTHLFPPDRLILLQCGVVMDPWTTPLGPEVYDRNAFKVPFIMIDSDHWLSGITGLL